MKHFSERSIKAKAHFFSEEVYSQILDSIVVTCTDIVLICGNELLLAKRCVYPIKDWWLLGGRMQSGESPQEAARRNLLKESTLDIDVSRFRFFEVYSTVFSKRKQEPKQNGSHTVNLAFIVKISNEEKKNIKLVESEYSEIKWIKIKELDSATEIDKPMIKNIIRDVSKNLN